MSTINNKTNLLIKLIIILFLLVGCEQQGKENILQYGKYGKYVAVQNYTLSAVDKQEIWANQSNLSWYQLTKTSFPEQSVLILKNNKLQIFDQKKGQLWLEFKNGGNVSSKLSILDSIPVQNQCMLMLDGILYVGSHHGGLKIINFKEDQILSYHSHSGWGGKFKNGIGKHYENELVLGAPYSLISHNIIALFPISFNQNYVAVISDKGVNLIKNIKFWKKT